jgi:exodeoxyribonuclease V alpha subunit
LAYATSIHKVQGSEFPCAVVIAHKSHSFMHHRNLLYTAVTRAKESVIILGDRWGIDNCAAKRQVDRRNTFLSFLLVSVRSGCRQNGIYALSCSLETAQIASPGLLFFGWA